MVKFEGQEQEHIDMPPEKDENLTIEKFTPESTQKAAEKAAEKEPSPEDVIVMTLLVKACYIGLCNLAYSFTQIEEAKATDSETEVLAAAWGPLMPKLSPVTLAIVATVGILAPKATTVVVKYREKKHGLAKSATGPTGQKEAVAVARQQADS